MNRYPGQYDRSEYGRQQGDSHGFSEGGYGEGFPGGMEHRLYSKLMADGRYADLDKAKHNEQYRNYLLENYDEDMPF